MYAVRGRYSREEEANVVTQYGINKVSYEDLPRVVLINTVEKYDYAGKPGSFQKHVRQPKRASRLRKLRNHR